MDKSLNSESHRNQWLILALQMAPFLLQIVGEVIGRYQGIPELIPERPYLPLENGSPENILHVVVEPQLEAPGQDSPSSKE